MGADIPACRRCGSAECPRAITEAINNAYNSGFRMGRTYGMRDVRFDLDALRAQQAAYDTYRDNIQIEPARWHE